MKPESRPLNLYWDNSSWRLSYSVRPNAATRKGGHATELIASGRFGRMVSLQGAEIGSIPLNEVAGKIKTGQ